MELKFIILASACIAVIEFQSYLYGIEIAGAGRSGERKQGFNRTFMELKSVYWFLHSWNGSEFQSYLYGIEITMRRYLGRVLRGFNRTFMELKFETTGMAIQFTVSFNRTFMELK